MKFLFIFFGDFTLHGKAVKANVQKIPVFFQKFRLFDLTFATKAMINSHILLKYRYLQKTHSFVGI